MDALRKVRRRSGFTLVELLVVIAIIALLISMLLPSLKAAREQAKAAKCLSNVRSISMSFVNYFDEQKFFPIYVQRTDSGTGWCTWSWGGWGGRNRDYWEQRDSGIFYVPTEKRPLSVFMTAGTIEPENKGADGLWNTADDRVTPMEVFECPSDFGSAQGEYWAEYGDRQQNEVTAYDDVGTSYQLSWLWWYQTYPQMNWEKKFEMGQRIWINASTRDSSRFMILYEDPADRAFHEGADSRQQRRAPGMQVWGFHGKFSKHVAGFMDAHGEHLYIDTRHETGPDYTTVDEWYRGYGNNPDWAYDCGYQPHLDSGLSPHRSRG